MRGIWVCLLTAMLCGPAFAQAADAPKTDVTAAYLKRDLAFLFQPKAPFLGFIGAHYQRLHIVFTTIRRDGADPHIYHVTGYSAVTSNRCVFSGEIVIGKIAAGAPPFSDDTYEAEQVKFLKIVSLGVIAARYTLREQPQQNHAGVFTGRLETWFDVDRTGQLIYDELADPETGWDNNRYIGHWLAYGSTAPKTANWGDQRIPESGDLDTGMHSFTPNKAYRANGWEAYHSEEDTP